MGRLEASPPALVGDERAVFVGSVLVFQDVVQAVFKTLQTILHADAVGIVAEETVTSMTTAVARLALVHSRHKM